MQKNNIRRTKTSMTKSEKVSQATRTIMELKVKTHRQLKALRNTQK